MPEAELTHSWGVNHITAVREVIQPSGGRGVLIEAKTLEAEKKSKKKAKKIRSTEIAYGWYKDANGWWYMEEDGNWHSNEWKNTNGTWSYLDADGYAKTGWFTVDGIWYYAGADGTLFVNTVTPDGYYVNADGAWV